MRLAKLGAQFSLYVPREPFMPQPLLSEPLIGQVDFNPDIVRAKAF
jgi:hypothetical protein